jgi:phospholipase D1/2
VSPSVPELETGCVNVHRKLMVVDDELLLVGSANLNNRSMVLDVECDIAIDANGDPRIRRALASMRNMLLAEHLGCEQKQKRVIDVEVEAPKRFPADG